MHTNLPLQLTSFVDRESELFQIKYLLSVKRATRLLTLTGPSGSGKTRLAQQAATDLLDDFPDGVWWIELNTLPETSLLAHSIASILNLPELPDMPLVDSLASFLRDKKLLLLFDNCSHAIEACARLAETLLRGCPELCLLVTSREALGIPGETIVSVLPLAVPDLRRLENAVAGSHPAFTEKQALIDELTSYSAVRLFLDRAFTIQPSFKLTPQNVLAAAQICSQLDGIPLAIELAAARVKTLSAQQIAGRLGDADHGANRFRLLTQGSRTALPRHQTLRAAIDWSYETLSERERILFHRLSVFVGGWTLEAAECVLSDEGEAIRDGTNHPPFRGSVIPSADVLDELSHLVDKSLVAMNTADDQPRYRMLETNRQYALDKLIQSGEAEAAYSRYAGYFIRLAEAEETALNGPDAARALELIEREHDNLREVLRQTLRTGEHETSLRLAVALWQFWLARSYWSEGRRWLNETLDANPGAPQALRARALTAARELARKQGEDTEVVHFPVQGDGFGAVDRPLRIFALGAAQVYRDGSKITSAEWKYAKTREMFFFLLCHPPRTKEQVGIALWPEASQAQLRSNFRVTLYHLRQALGSPDWIRFEDEHYAFNRAKSYWFDVEVFENRLISARLASKLTTEADAQAETECLHGAISLYRGDFLEDSTAYEWCLERKQELAREYLNALLLIGKLLFNRRQYEQAAEIYQKAITADHYCEVAHRALVRCYARLGDCGQALRHYQDFYRLLAGELGAFPSEETRALYDRLRSGEPV